MVFAFGTILGGCIGIIVTSLLAVAGRETRQTEQRQKDIAMKPTDNCMYQCCPICGNVDIAFSNYCDVCGQKLDWSEADE